MISILEKRSVAIALTIFIAFEIFFISSLSGVSTGGGSPWIPRMYHVMVFFLFSFFLFYSLRSKEKITLLFIAIALIISILYAASDELHQLYVPGRDGSLRDFFTNTLGIFVSTLFFLFISNKRLNNKKKKS